MADYLTLAKRFTIGRPWRQDHHYGTVVVGREGFYLIFNHISKLRDAMALATSSFESHAIPKDQKSRDCPLIWRGAYHELAESVTGHADWPAVAKPDQTWFMAKEVIDQVKVSIWTGLTIRIGEAQYNIPVGMFSTGRVREGLKSLGWL